MNLLPKDHEQFRQSDYWDGFFQKRGGRAFEWYGEYTELCGILHKYIKLKDDILVVGCGNSTLSADLYNVGYQSMVSIDLSDVAIRQMNQVHGLERPGLSFVKMDVTDLAFEENRFSCVLDKGTLDAMMTNNDAEVQTTIDKMFSEIERVLRLGGRYICISLLQPHILDFITQWFSQRGWPLRILRCQEADANKSPQDRLFPVFAIVATKFRKMPNIPQVLEMALSSEGQTTRLKTVQDLIRSVRGVQQFAAVRAGAAKKRLFQGDARHEDVSLDLQSPDSDVPKYSLFIVDRDQASPLKFAVFIVPQGREPEWLFSTSKGRSQLAESAGVAKLIVVHLQRTHTFTNLQAVQEELSGIVMDLAPPDLPHNTQVPFLSLGGDGAVGSRSERCRGKSKFSGEFVVEDVEVNGELFRRLIFMNNPNLTQSEAKIVSVKSKNKKVKKVVDHSYLACAHHSYMVGALGYNFSQPEIKVLLVGLGGGALATFIKNNFPKVTLDVVEIDPAISRVASEQFDFKEDERTKVIIADGIEFLNTIKTETYDVIMLDVDSKDSSIGMSCPPKPFVEAETIRQIQHHCLTKDQQGVFVLNLVCRDPSLRQEVIATLKSQFTHVVSCPIPEEVNEILYCSSSSQREGNVGVPSITSSHASIKAMRRVNETLRNEDFLDLAQSLKVMKVV
ncbi:hypothetical protein TCAL_04600 [Tigriopus californicus]|uniref:Methyltransferase domain-containing protein n=1 Tax=Tigriopus californicus TaxID=6832 RepID=A0A553P9P1_TIGCA|nr:eEF1A lysine and N-terminal methyltransferase-like [Tigriopus californicus]TRY74390.1 hypothetical protein TCAL_04600 [Tigriopus californicus]